MKKDINVLIVVFLFFLGCENETNNQNNALNNNNSTNTNNTTDTSEISYLEMFSSEQVNQEIIWYSCALSEGGSDENAFCADFEVPLDWNNQASELISIRVKKTKKMGEVKRRVIMLQGGPGGSSTIDFPYYMSEMSLLDPETEFIAFDHRGTGFSTFITCPSAVSVTSEYGMAIGEEELAECMENELLTNRDYLEKFNITNASMDIGYFIELIRDNSVRNHVYGVSYGSAWAHRYAQIFPNQASSVTLDSMCLVGACYLDDYDKNSEKGFTNLLSECDENTMCAQKMGGDSVEFVRSTLEKLKNGHCSDFDPDLVRYLTFNLAQQKPLSAMAIALWYRLSRCSPEDVEAINNLISVVFGKQKNNSLYVEDLPLSVIQSNYILFMNIAASEMIHLPTYSVDFVNERTSDLISGAKLDYRMALLGPDWPVYEIDNWYGSFAENHRNFLMLNGTHDLQTPENVSTFCVTKLREENHFDFLVPWANHGVLWSSEVNSRGQPGCGMSIFLEYIKNPEIKPVGLCMEDLKRPDFIIPGDYSSYFFGRPDAWENTTKNSGNKISRATEKYLNFLTLKMKTSILLPL